MCICAANEPSPKTITHPLADHLFLIVGFENINEQIFIVEAYAKGMLKVVVVVAAAASA
jgi:hypothetical protein